MKVFLFVLLLALATASANRLVYTLNVPDDGADRVFIQTVFGPIPIKLLPANAPTTVAAVKEMVAREGSCAECSFYRNEARPQASQGSGPPYGLLQGRLDLVTPYPEVEGTLPTKAGSVALIPGTPDFFIALSDHDEWGTSHTVWGEIEDWFVTDFIAAREYKETKDPTHGTLMRMMVPEEKFVVGASQFFAPTAVA